MTTREKIAVITGLIYIALMGVGMALLSSLGWSYSDPEMVRVIVFFEAIFMILTLSVYRKLKLTALTQPFRFSKWLIPFMVIFVIIIGLWIVTGTLNAHLPLLGLIAITTLFVGFSEELMFRGIVLHVLLERRGVVFSIMMSALFFSLLHAVNVFAGVPWFAVPLQLVATFLFGVVFSCLALLIRNLLPLILYHFVWDFVLVSQPLTGAHVDNVTLIGILVELLIVVPLVVYTVKHYRRGHLATS